MRKIDLRSEIAKHVILPLIVLTWISSEGISQSLCPKSILDERDGNKYKTVQMGDQCWMAQNLNVGTLISGSENPANNAVIEKYCYNNSELQCSVYGGLYQWNEMMQYATTSGVQGICPAGWHVPSDTEWTTLENFVSSQPAYLCENDIRIIAKALASTTNWNTASGTCAVGNNLAANNATGFSGLPAGFYLSGSFNLKGSSSLFWSATQGSFGTSWNRYLTYSYGALYRVDFNPLNGFSVRCLKDN